MKSALPDVSLMINQMVKVNVSLKRHFIGILKSTDAFLNLHLVDVVDETNSEYVSVVVKGDCIESIYLFKQ